MPRSKNNQLIGIPAPSNLAAKLERELSRMAAQIRRSVGQISGKQDIRSLGAALKREWSDARLREIVAKIGLAAERQGSKPWIKAKLTPDRVRADGVRFDAEYDGHALVEQWTREAFGYIRSVRDEVVEGMRRDFITAISRGETIEALAAKWRRQGIPVQFGTLEGRIKVIAQHQTSSLHAQIQRTRAAAVGVTEFFWRTQGDSKVRDAHVALADTRHSYASPPSEGLPGTPINCRCWAESIVPDELLENFSIRGVISA